MTKLLVAISEDIDEVKKAVEEAGKKRPKTVMVVIYDTEDEIVWDHTEKRQKKLEGDEAVNNICRHMPGTLNRAIRRLKSLKTQ